MGTNGLIGVFIVSEAFLSAISSINHFLSIKEVGNDRLLGRDSNLSNLYLLLDLLRPENQNYATHVL